MTDVDLDKNILNKTRKVLKYTLQMMKVLIAGLEEAVKQRWGLTVSMKVVPVPYRFRVERLFVPGMVGVNYTPCNFILDTWKFLRTADESRDNQVATSLLGYDGAPLASEIEAGDLYEKPYASASDPPVQHSGLTKIFSDGLAKLYNTPRVAHPQKMLYI